MTETEGRYRVSCSCGAVLNAPASALGKSAPCPKCGATLTVGQAPPQVEATPVVNYRGPDTQGEVCTPRTVELLDGTRIWVRMVSLALWIVVGLCVVVGAISVMGVGSARRPNNAAPFALVGYVIMGLIYLMPAIYLNRYSSLLGEYSKTRSPDVLERAMQAQKSFWKFAGICILLLFAFYLLVFGLVGFAALR